MMTVTYQIENVNIFLQKFFTIIKIMNYKNYDYKVIQL